MDFERLANEHKDAVYRHMIRVCGNREDAEDVLIEALLKAYRNLDRLRESAAFRSWLRTIAQRICWQLKQRKALQPLLQLSVLEEEAGQVVSREEPVDAQVALREMKSLFARAVESLPVPERRVYELRDLEGLTGEEVATRLKISLAAMKSRLHRARANVRKKLDQSLQVEERWKSQ